MKTSPLLPPLPSAALAIPWTAGLPRDLLAPGEILPVLLVAALDDHRALIQIKGKQLTAEIPFPLPDQGEFRVRVDQVEPRIVLRLLAAAAPGDVPPEVRLKAYLAGDRPGDALIEAWKHLSRIEKSTLPEEIRESWTAFQETLKTISARFASHQAVDALKDLVNLSGLNWENKLHRLVLQETEPGRAIPIREDLKGFLLTLKSRLDPVDPDLAQSIPPLLHKIELGQWLNAVDGGQGDLLLFFPWYLPEGPGWAELLISGDRSARGPAGDEGQSLLFLLYLPALGKLRVEVTIRGRLLYGRFKTEASGVSELLDRQIPRLKSALSALGYQAVLESQVVEPEQLGDSLPARMENFSASLISRVV